MGYSQIAGLPVVYGLYGSMLPILIYGLLTTSPQFVVGVDAMPAAMVGGLLATLGIPAESSQAMGLVPLVAILTAAWFLIFYLVKAGRIVKYISTPVMGGFISGVGVTIILMQIPKLFGGSAGTGELFVLLGHIAGQLPHFHLLSSVLGFGTVAIILVCKKIIPKVPMTVVMLAVGAMIQIFFHVDQAGVKLLPEVSAGLPKLIMPDFSLLLVAPSDILIEALSIAAVIMAQTLLATGNYAAKYGDKVDNNAELLAYAGMNVVGGLTGCCPINGSVSRSGIADSFGARSQIMSISATVTMLLVLLFGTPMLKYLPVPILTGIVMTALIGILETRLMQRLWKTSKNEWLIFLISFLGVLLFGTVRGVVIGCLLSFGEVAMRATQPPTTFVGRIPGQGNFYPLTRNSGARPIEHTVIYRFSGNLFFANVDRFQKEIERAILPETRVVVVDARGIGSIDITATDRLVSLYQSLKKSGVRFYLAEHDGSLNDQLSILGGQILLEEGAVRRTITLALQDVGIEKPYKLVKPEDREYLTEVKRTIADVDNEQALAEIEWVFGSQAEERIQKLADETAGKLTEQPELLQQEHLETRWGHLNIFDEGEFLDALELRLEELRQEGLLNKEQLLELEKRVEKRRQETEARLKDMDPQALKRLRKYQEHFQEYIQQHHPEEYRHMQEIRKRWKKS